MTPIWCHFYNGLLLMPLDGGFVIRVEPDLSGWIFLAGWGFGQETGVYVRSTSPRSHWCSRSPLPTHLSTKHHWSLVVSVAATGPYHHIFVFLQYDIGVVVEVEHRDGVQLCGGAAWLRDVLRVHQVYLKITGNTLSFFRHQSAFDLV